MRLCVLIFAIAKLSWCLKTLDQSMKSLRVVGGTSANENSAPFIVSFQHKGIHYCAGSIISKNWVLTAAHCLSSNAQVMDTILMSGSIYIAGTSTTTQKRGINYYVFNDLYLGGTSPYDIGLVYTKTPFIWTIAVNAINLPTDDYSSTGNAVLYGWGSISKDNNAKYPSILQLATVPIIPLDTCAKALSPNGKNVHNTNLCSGPLTGGVGICTSDSGGPLIQNIKGQQILVGIVSWGKLPCGQINSPSVYVKVSSMLSWIRKSQYVPK